MRGRGRGSVPSPDELMEIVHERGGRVSARELARELGLQARGDKAELKRRRLRELVQRWFAGERSVDGLLRGPPRSTPMARSGPRARTHAGRQPSSSVPSGPERHPAPGDRISRPPDYRDDDRHGDRPAVQDPAQGLRARWWAFWRRHTVRGSSSCPRARTCQAGIHESCRGRWRRRPAIIVRVIARSWRVRSSPPDGPKIAERIGRSRRAGGGVDGHRHRARPADRSSRRCGHRRGRARPSRCRSPTARISASSHLVTIDGADARDFDDAVWGGARQRRRQSGRLSSPWWRLPMSPTMSAPARRSIKDAQERGNSVYFPDRVIPMLPEALSNELCSLKPEVDRACIACRMRFDGRGQPQATGRFVRGLMRSQAPGSLTSRCKRHMTERPVTVTVTVMARRHRSRS